MEDRTEIQFIIQPPYQLMVGVEFYPEEWKDGTLLYNEFSIHLLILSIKIIW